MLVKTEQRKWWLRELPEQYTGTESLTRMHGTMSCLDKGILHNLECYA